MLRRVIVVLLVLAAGVSALWLLLHRQNISYRTLDERYAADSSHYLTLSNDLVVHFTDEGSEDAPVIVLVHGFASSPLSTEQLQWVTERTMFTEHPLERFNVSTLYAQSTAPMIQPMRRPFLSG